jgi:hypothetical protein
VGRGPPLDQQLVGLAGDADGGVGVVGLGLDPGRGVGVAVEGQDLVQLRLHRRRLRLAPRAGGGHLLEVGVQLATGGHNLVGRRLADGRVG